MVGLLLLANKLQLFQYAITILNYPLILLNLFQILIHQFMMQLVLPH